jgi:hypothetical protein
MRSIPTARPGGISPTAGLRTPRPSIGPDGTIYIGSSDKNLYALTDGGQGTVTQNWSFTTAGTVSDPAIGSDATVFVGSADDNLYAVNSDGSQKWKFATSGAVGSAAIGADGTVYVGSADGNLYAVGTMTASPSPTATATPTTTATPTPTVISTIAAPTPTATATATATATPTVTATPTPAPVDVKLRIAPKVLDFRAIKIGTSSKPKTVRVFNPKGDNKHPGLPVVIEMISAPGVFAQTNDCPGILPAGAQCRVSVTFTPNAATRQTGTLTITDNAEGNLETMRLVGRGK